MLPGPRNDIAAAKEAASDQRKRGATGSIIWSLCMIAVLVTGLMMVNFWVRSFADWFPKSATFIAVLTSPGSVAFPLVYYLFEGSLPEPLAMGFWMAFVLSLAFAFAVPMGVRLRYRSKTKSEEQHTDELGTAAVIERTRAGHVEDRPESGRD
jgi:hypothetical protein